MLFVLYNTHAYIFSQCTFSDLFTNIPTYVYVTTSMYIRFFVRSKSVSKKVRLFSSVYITSLIQVQKETFPTLVRTLRNYDALCSQFVLLEQAVDYAVLLSLLMNGYDDTNTI